MLVNKTTAFLLLLVFSCVIYADRISAIDALNKLTDSILSVRAKEIEFEKQILAISKKTYAVSLFNVLKTKGEHEFFKHIRNGASRLTSIAGLVEKAQGNKLQPTTAYGKSPLRPATSCQDVLSKATSDLVASGAMILGGAYWITSGNTAPIRVQCKFENNVARTIVGYKSKSANGLAQYNPHVFYFDGDVASDKLAHSHKQEADGKFSCLNLKRFDSLGTQGWVLQMDISLESNSSLVVGMNSVEQYVLNSASLTVLTPTVQTTTTTVTLSPLPENKKSVLEVAKLMMQKRFTVPANILETTQLLDGVNVKKSTMDQVNPFADNVAVEFSVRSK